MKDPECVPVCVHVFYTIINIQPNNSWYIISGCQSCYIFFNWNLYLIKNQSTAKRFLVYYIRLLKSVYLKKNVLGSNEYFVVYIDIINLKLKQEIIIQQLLTITLLLINAIISIKALWLSLEGHGHDVSYNFFFFIWSILCVFNAWPKFEWQSDKLKFH